MENSVLYKNVSGVGSKESKALMKIAIWNPMLISAVAFPLSIALLGVVWLLEGDLTFAIIMFVLAVALAIFCPLLFILVFNHNSKKLIGGRRLLNTFEFYEDHLAVKTENIIETESIVTGTSNIIYQNLFKVVVNKEYIFIFINKQQSFILDQKGMVEGDVNGLLEFLKGKVARFKDKRKKV